MFGFGKKYKEQADKIGIVLHEQIFGALQENEKLAGVKMQSPFFVGYISCFVSTGLIAQGVPSEQVDKYLKYICDGVLPGRLWQIYSSQLMAAEQIEAFSGTPIEGFEKGGAVGMWDGSNIITWDESASRTNLKSYLLDKELDYLEPKA